MAWRGLGPGFLSVLLLGGCLGGGAEPLLIESFETTSAGSMPATMRSAIGDWRVQVAPAAPSGDQVLVQASTRYLHTYALATRDMPADLQAQVRLQILSGADHREAGLTVRYRSPDENYVFNIDANEGGVRFTRVHDGIRDDIYKDRTTRFLPNQWYELALVADGPLFLGYVDGRQVFQVRDSTHAEGRIGLWTRQDTTARFDDLLVTA